MAICKAKTVKVLKASAYSSVVSNKMDFGEAKASNHKMDVFQFFCAFNACLSAHNSSVLNTSHMAIINGNHNMVTDTRYSLPKSPTKRVPIT